jgi:hypothetical protein
MTSDECGRPCEEGSAAQARALARVIAKAVDKGIRTHEDRLHELGIPGPIPPVKLAEIVAWLGAEWAITGVWDVEAASAKFDVASEVLWPELANYFHSRARRGRERRN